MKSRRKDNGYRSYEDMIVVLPMKNIRDNLRYLRVPVKPMSGGFQTSYRFYNNHNNYFDA